MFTIEIQMDKIQAGCITCTGKVAKATANGNTITGNYDEENRIATFTDDYSGQAYNHLADILPAGTPHYVDGLPGTF